MATAEGGDLLLKVLDEVRGMKTGFQARFDAIDARLEELNRRVDNTNDTLTLIGGVLQRAVSTAKERFDDHERRIRTLEEP